jgi:DNA-binding transcriptional ArsR family regulator
MSLTNPPGDAQAGSPLAMRALAHPTRLAILSYLQRSGPATATILAPHVGATPSVTSWHLRHLAGFGLVVDVDPAEAPGDRRHRWWKALALELGAGPDPRLRPGHPGPGHLVAQVQAQINQWLSDVEPSLEPAWVRLSGPSDTSVALTPDELKSVAAKIDELLAPYVHRAASEAPPEARIVRIVRHYLPAGPH